MPNGNNSCNDDQFSDKVVFVVNEVEEVDKCPAVMHLCTYGTSRKMPAKQLLPCGKHSCFKPIFIVYSDDPN